MQHEQKQKVHLSYQKELEKSSVNVVLKQAIISGIVKSEAIRQNMISEHLRACLHKGKRSPSGGGSLPKAEERNT